MKKVIIEAENLESIQWPAKCSGCGQDLLSESTNMCDVKIVKTVSQMFSLKKIKTVSVQLCGKCAKSFTGFASLLLWVAGVLFVLAIGSPLFFTLFPEAPQDTSGPAGCFWLSIFLGFIANILPKIKVSGVRCVWESKNRWVFSFQNENFAHAFSDMNSTHVYRISMKETELKDIEHQFRNWPSDKLVRATTVEKADYEPEALGLMVQELSRRDELLSEKKP